MEEQKDASGSLLGTKTYAYDAFGMRIGMTRTPSSQPTERFTFGFDVHGSVSLLIDQSSQARASYGYRAYGGRDAALTQGDTSSTDVLNPYRYTGKRLDTGSGTLDMGARRFSPDTGRFLQQDGYSGGAANLGLALDPLAQNRYGFAGGNPLGFIESDGHRFYMDGFGAGYFKPTPPSPPAPAPTAPAPESSACGSGISKSVCKANWDDFFVTPTMPPPAPPTTPRTPYTPPGSPPGGGSASTPTAASEPPSDVIESSTPEDSGGGFLAAGASSPLCPAYAASFVKRSTFFTVTRFIEFFGIRFGIPMSSVHRFTFAANASVSYIGGHECNYQARWGLTYDSRSLPSDGGLDFGFGFDFRNKYTGSIQHVGNRDTVGEIGRHQAWPARLEGSTTVALVPGWEAIGVLLVLSLSAGDEVKPFVKPYYCPMSRVPDGPTVTSPGRIVGTVCR
jgi:RHS repeat-associated protein